VQIQVFSSLLFARIALVSCSVLYKLKTNPELVELIFICFALSLMRQFSLPPALSFNASKILVINAKIRLFESTCQCINIFQESQPSVNNFVSVNRASTII